MEFGRLVTAMVTPFDEEQRIDETRVIQLIEHLIATGTTAVVVSGTTGESPTLSRSEKLQLFSWVVKAVAGRVPVIAGTGTNDTRATIEFSKEAEQTGVNGLLLVTPYYNRPTQRGLIHHFQAVAAQVDLPIMLYNVPGRTSVNLEPASTLELSSVQNIVAVKDAADISQVMEIAANAPNGFRVYTGEDKLVLPALAVGAYGVVSVCSQLIGTAMTRLIEAYAAGDTTAALEWNRKILPVLGGAFRLVNPTLVKAVLNDLDVPVGGLRLPLVDPTPEESAPLIREVRRVLTEAL